MSSYTTVYPFIHLLKDILVVSKFGNYEQSCYPCACFCVDLRFQLIWVNTNMCNCWTLPQVYVLFCKKLTNYLPKWLCHFALPSAMSESSCGFTSSPALGDVGIWEVGPLNRCTVVSHCCCISLMRYHVEGMEIWFANHEGLPNHQNYSVIQHIFVESQILLFSI